jgi:hypothetical protein
MRIITFDEPYSVILRVEGAMRATDAADVCARATTLQAAAPAKKLLLDLGDVDVLEDGAAACLRRLRREHGARFIAAGPFVARAVEEIEVGRTQAFRNWMSKIGIQVAEHPQPSRLCRVLRALLPAELTPCGR